MSDDTFCVLCGKSHPLAAACDPAWLEWVRVRRAEIARGVPYQQATPIPSNVSTNEGA